MASPVARIGDTCTGWCSAHNGTIAMTGTITTGATITFIDSSGKAVARIGDICTGSCGHTGVINSGAPTVFCEGTDKNVARVGDTFTGTFYGTITSGSPTCYA